MSTGVALGQPVGSDGFYIDDGKGLHFAKDGRDRIKASAWAAVFFENGKESYRMLFKTPEGAIHWVEFCESQHRVAQKMGWSDPEVNAKVPVAIVRPDDRGAAFPGSFSADATEALREAGEHLYARWKGWLDAALKGEDPFKNAPLSEYRDVLKQAVERFQHFQSEYRQYTGDQLGDVASELTNFESKLATIERRANAGGHIPSRPGADASDVTLHDAQGNLFRYQQVRVTDGVLRISTRTEADIPGLPNHALYQISLANIDPASPALVAQDRLSCVEFRSRIGQSGTVTAWSSPSRSSDPATAGGQAQSDPTTDFSACFESQASARAFLNQIRAGR